ncbi:MAG: hypothetical protein A2139_04360 [Desulfobacca sp. RBG_16_60_12]|nr:MAG: hypothetical protein A2139_04360 [Desulfobacca sp. RBG_16_60_12]
MFVCISGKKIDFTLAYPGFDFENGKQIGIAFHPVCRGEFAKILINTFIKDEKFREKQKQKS